MAAYVFERIALIGRYQSTEVAHALQELAMRLQEWGCTVLVESDTARATNLGHLSQSSYAEIGANAQLAIVLGGDGTMLSVGRQLARYAVPLVGVNQGHLGFLTDIPREEMLVQIQRILAGQYKRESRVLLDAEVLRDNACVLGSVALNDVVISKGESGRLIEFELHIDGELIYTLRADGMIVATPTGSTAYALSANGPILHPHVGGIAIVPLCPHGLTYRPIALNNDVTVEFVLLPPHDARIHFDGQIRFEARAGDTVRLRRSQHVVELLHPDNYSYYAALREKLNWSTAPRFA